MYTVRTRVKRLEDRIKGVEGSPNSSRNKRRKAVARGRSEGTAKGKWGGVQLGIKRFLAAHRQDQKQTCPLQPHQSAEVCHEQTQTYTSNVLYCPRHGLDTFTQTQSPLHTCKSMFALESKHKPSKNKSFSLQHVFQCSSLSSSSNEEISAPLLDNTVDL